MADQLREARRRRIIENSEKRLQRILGVTTSNDGVSEYEEHQTELLTKSAPEFTSGHQNIKSFVTNDHAVINEESYTRKRAHVDSTVTEVTNPTKSTRGILGNSLFELDGITASLNENKINPEQPKNWSGLLVLLAITSITLLYTSFGILIGNNILIPFGIFEAYVFLATKNNEIPTNNMINTVLMLSGLPQETLSKLTKILRLFQTLLQDLCVYLFGCLMCYQIYTYIV